MVFRRVPLTTGRCSANPTVVLHLLAPSQPESQLRSTKPEPIVTCGCTGKLPGMKYSSVSLSLGGAFRMISRCFSRITEYWAHQCTLLNHSPPRGILNYCLES